MSELDDLQTERARIIRRLREMNAARDRGEDWDEDEEINLSRALATIEAQIRELGGTLQPVPRDGVTTPPTGGATPPAQPGGTTPTTPDGTTPTVPTRPAGATTHLGAPPETIDQIWNDLIAAYRRAQQAAADHAMIQRDNWACSHADARTHTGCGIWWRGQLENHLQHLRDAANRLIDDQAGPRTPQEVANDQAVIDIRTRELAPLEVEIAQAEARLQQLLDQFAEDEKTYKALRDAGGDVAPYTGVVSAGRHRLLFDIEAAQQALNALHRRRTEVLARLRTAQTHAGTARRDRGLAEARDRWPELDLDLDALTDDELLNRLLGDEQYQRMQAEMERQGTHLNRQRTRRTSWIPAPAVLVAILVLLALAIGVLAWSQGGTDEVAGEPVSDVGGIESDADEPADPVDGQPIDDEPIDDELVEDEPVVVDQPVACAMYTDFELLGIEVVPGSHHQGNIAVSVTDGDGMPVDGAEVFIRTEKSDGTQTVANSTTVEGRVIFGMQTTDYGVNTLFVTDVVKPECTWYPGEDPCITWVAVP